VTFRLGLLVALMGAVGSVARWLISNLLQKPVGSAFPVGTLAVNVLGSLAIGFVMAIFTARGTLEAPARIAITAGLLGGFTTFSAFAYEAWALVEGRSSGRAAAYVALTLVLGVGACIVGLAAGRSLAR
jgi:fluoride exporter